MPLIHRMFLSVAIKIKRNKDNVKFKARTARFLVTLVVKDTAKAEKLIKLLPPSMSDVRILSITNPFLLRVITLIL